MRKILIIFIIFIIGGIFNMAVIANTLKGFMPGKIDRQNVTQEPGSFGTYTEKESKVPGRFNSSFVTDPNLINRPFDIEKESQNPIKPTIKPENFEQEMEWMLNEDKRDFLTDKQGKNTRMFHIDLPQRY